MKSEEHVSFAKLISPPFEKNIEPLYNAGKTNGPVLIGFQEVKNFESQTIHHYGMAHNTVTYIQPIEKDTTHILAHILESDFLFAYSIFLGVE